MKLYYSPGACSLASHICAEEAGLDFDYERVDLSKHVTETGKDCWRINPKGYVPALELDDGSLLTENAALLPFIADINPDSGLAPQPASGIERARLVEWVAFISTELHKSFGALIHKSDGAEKARQSIIKRLSFIDGRLKGQDFLMGDMFTVADAYLFVILRWCAKYDIDLGPFKQLGAYRDRIAARPAVKKALAAEGLAKPSREPAGSHAGLSG